MGVWSTAYLYQPVADVGLHALLPALEATSRAVNIDTFSSGSIGVDCFDGCGEESTLEEMTDQPLGAFMSALERHPEARYISASCIMGEPDFLDDADACMGAFPDVIGDFNIFTFGITLGNIRIEDEEGDPLFASHFMLDFAGDSCPADTAAYAQRLKLCDPIQQIFKDIRSHFDPSSWQSAMVVS